MGGGCICRRSSGALYHLLLGSTVPLVICPCKPHAMLMPWPCNDLASVHHSPCLPVPLQPPFLHSSPSFPIHHTRHSTTLTTMDSYELHESKHVHQVVVEAEDTVVANAYPGRRTEDTRDTRTRVRVSRTQHFSRYAVCSHPIYRESSASRRSSSLL